MDLESTRTSDSRSNFEGKARFDVRRLQESLRESSCQVTLLKQREREQELERERGRERERDRERCTQVLKELESSVQALVDQGLVQMRRSPSGHLDLQVVPSIQQVSQKGRFSIK